MKKFLFGAVLGVGVGIIIGPVLAVEVLLRTTYSEHNDDNELADALDDAIGEIMDVDEDTFADFILNPILGRVNKFRG